MAAKRQAEASAERVRVQVKTGRIGYYNNVRWRQGQVFQLNKPADFSSLWMAKVDPSTKLDRPMSGPQALDKAVQTIKGGGSTDGLVTDNRDHTGFGADDLGDVI